MARVLVRKYNGRLQKRCVLCHRWLYCHDPARGFHRGYAGLIGSVRNECRQCRNGKRDWAADYRRYCKPWRERKRAERQAA